MRISAQFIGRTTTLMVVLLALIVFHFQAQGCSDSNSDPLKVGRDFTVKVRDRGKLVAGLEIELSTDPVEGDSRTVMVATGTSGIARFAKIRPGLYFVGTKQPAFPQSIEIEVVKRKVQQLESKIEFDWPSTHFLETTSVSGVLTGRISSGTGVAGLIRDMKDPHYGPVAGVKLTLLMYVSGETVSVVTSDENGRFSFGDVPPGSYFVREQTPSTAKVRYPSDAYMAIEVNPSSPVKGLNIVLDEAICGALAYSNELAKNLQNMKKE